MADVRTINILGMPVNPLTMAETVEFLHSKIISGEQSLVVTANAEIVMLGTGDPAYLDLIRSQAQLVLPDGAGTVWAGRYLGYDVPERVAGYDLFHSLMQLAAREGYGCFFFGGQEGIAETAAAKAKELYPGLEVSGCLNGYFTQEDNSKIVAQINAGGAKILFTALGAPKQEFWLAAHRKELLPVILLGIGGSFDVLAGKVQRAPLWMQKAGLEWFYRLLKQPSRAGRMLALPKFVYSVLTE